MSVEDSSTKNFFSPNSDARQLWTSFLNGDIQAWEKIFNLFYKDLYGYGLKLSTQPELTKDCIHTLFVTLWDRRDHLDEVESVKAYLLTSLRRSLLKKITKQRKYYRNPNSDSREITPDAVQFSPEEIIIRDEMKAYKRKTLYIAIESLPDRQKEALYLKYFNGMSYGEIEEILSINYQSIRNHIYRAIKKLGEIMDEDISEIAISLLPILVLFSVWL